MTMILFIALKMALPSAPWCSGSHPQDATLQQDPSCALLFYVLKCPAKTQRNSRVVSWNIWEWRHYFGWEIPAILKKSTLEDPVVVFWRKRQGDPGCTVFCCCWYSWQSEEASLSPPSPPSLQMLRRLLQWCKGNTVAQAHMHTHTHVPVSSSTLQFNRKKRESLPLFPDSLHDWHIFFPSLLIKVQMLQWKCTALPSWTS